MFCTISPWLATSSASSMARDCDQEMTLECKNILQNATNRKYKKCLIFFLLFYQLWFVQCLDWLQGKCRRSALVLCKFNMGHLIDSLAFFILVLNEGRRGGGQLKKPHCLWKRWVCTDWEGGSNQFLVTNCKQHHKTDLRAALLWT